MSMEIHIKKNGPIKAYTKLMIKYAKLLNENNRLKNMVEKMKCCYNCKHSRTEYEHCRTDKHEKWEIKEND